MRLVSKRHEVLNHLAQHLVLFRFDYDYALEARGAGTV